MELLEILEEFQNSNEIISSGFSCDVIPDKLFLLRHCLQFKWQGFIRKRNQSFGKGARFCAISKEGE